MDEALEWRIRLFFRYWRERYKFIHNLDLEKNNHEAQILLWAAFDALSNLWAKHIGKQHFSENKMPQKRLIFDAFLAQYANDLFQLVSLPHIWYRADKEKDEKNLPRDVCTFLSKIGGRQDSTLSNMQEIYQVRNDLTLDEVIAATLKNYPTTDPNALKKWLIWSRYGAIAYKEVRCSYIHEGRAGKNTHGFNLARSPIQPTYSSYVYQTPPVIGFGIQFMLCVLKDCIDNFEAEAMALQQDPAPEE